MRRRMLTSTVALAALTAGSLTAPALAGAATPPATTASAAARTTPAPPVSAEDRRLRRALQRVVDAGAVGVTAQVIDRGLVWRGAAGSAHLGPRRPATPDARFRAASVSKMITSVLALQLVERGTWTLDTTIGDVMPGLWPARSDVTVRQLLSHTSGVPDYLPGMVAKADTVKKFRAVIRKKRVARDLVGLAKKQDWLFEPGTSFAYSNTGYVLVGMMLARETGVPLARLARTKVLKPAGMTRSRWATGRRMVRPALTEYGALGKGGRQVDLSAFHPSMFAGAGALVSTARDLNRFQYALSKGRLVERSTLETMRAVAVDVEEAGLPYGLGTYSITDPCRPRESAVYGHDGASWGTLTLSFSSADGRRRVTVAMTGREYTRDQPAFQALNRFLGLALRATCRRAPEARTVVPAPTVVPRTDVVAPPLG
jgi:D-alanyl-D-alanine carboxypeptidase